MIFDLLEKASRGFAATKIAGFTIIQISHALWISWNFRRTGKAAGRQPLEVLVATWILSFGGTTLTAIILGKPWGWIQGDTNFPVYTIVPLLVYYSPSDIVYRALESSANILLPFLLVAESISRALSISISGVEAVRSHVSSGLVMENSNHAAIFCGTLAGCGGGIIGSMIGLENKNWSFRIPTQLGKPTTTLVVSFFGAILYWFLSTHPLGIKVSPFGSLVALLLTISALPYISPFFIEQGVVALVRKKAHKVRRKVRKMA